MPQDNATIEVSTSNVIKTVFILLGLVLLYLVRDVILLLLISVTLASALEPLVSASHRRLKFPRPLTVILVYVVVIGLIGSFFYVLTPAFIDQFKELGLKYNEFVSNVETGQGPLYEFLRTAGLGDSLKNLVGDLSGPSTNALGRAVNFVTGFLEIIAILVISFYLVAEQGAMRATVKQFLPDKHKEKAAQVITAIQRKLGFWLLGQLLLSLAIFMVTFVVLSILNVPLALALAALAGMLEILPFLGPIIAAVPAILIAFTQSPAMALAVAILYLLVQKMENYVLVPKIMEKTVGVHPLLILISVLMGFKLAGIFGALLAVPIVAAVSVLFEAYVVGRHPVIPQEPQVLFVKEKNDVGNQ